MRVCVRLNSVRAGRLFSVREGVLGITTGGLAVTCGVLTSGVRVGRDVGTSRDGVLQTE